MREGERGVGCLAADSAAVAGVVVDVSVAVSVVVAGAVVVVVDEGVAVAGADDCAVAWPDVGEALAAGGWRTGGVGQVEIVVGF